MIVEVTRAIKRGAGRTRAELGMLSALRARSNFKRVKNVSLSLSRNYYFTSEKGLFRLDNSGIYRLMDTACYGIAIGGPWIFLALYIYGYAIVVRGDRRALYERGRSFDFIEIYRVRTISSNERIHGIFLGDKALWIANTAHNTLLKVDPESANVIAEIPVIVDQFGCPVLYNNNHINSVAEYGGVVLFVAYRAGRKSLIGIYDGASVTGYGYPHVGVHDVFLTDTGFFLCDTFGSTMDTAGGIPVNERGRFDPEFFTRPPGYIVRGLAGNTDELLIGHSHKGERARRFAGHGAILIANDCRIVNRIDVEPAQIYQIITEDGEFALPRPASVDASETRLMFHSAFGDPIYQAVLTDGAGGDLPLSADSSSTSRIPV